MNVAFNITPLTNDHKNRGIGFYTKRLLNALKELENRNLKIIEYGTKVPENADLVHYPFFDPFFRTLPISKNKPSVVTVHDLIPLVFPDKFPKGIRGEINWQIQRLSLRTVTSVITDSASSLKDVAKIIGVDQNKIYVVPLAPSTIYKKITDGTKLGAIKKKYKLPKTFILYVGDVNWNKNIRGLIKAFYKLKTVNQRLNPKLVLVGRTFLNTNLTEMQEINQLIRELRQEREILKLGFVSEEDLAAIYNLAKVYVQPSFYEGFGLPVLEALSCGCLVVCSYTSSLTEVGGEAVLYFNPQNLEDMAEKIMTVLGYDTMMYQRIQKNGIVWAQKFTWKKTAQQTVRVYEKAGNK